MDQGEAKLVSLKLTQNITPVDYKRPLDYSDFKIRDLACDLL